MDGTRRANSQQVWAHFAMGGNHTGTFTGCCDPIMHQKPMINTPLPYPICILMLNFAFLLEVIFPKMTLDCSKKFSSVSFLEPGSGH